MIMKPYLEHGALRADCGYFVLEGVVLLELHPELPLPPLGAQPGVVLGLK